MPNNPQDPKETQTTASVREETIKDHNGRHVEPPRKSLNDPELEEIRKQIKDNLETQRFVNDPFSQNILPKEVAEALADGFTQRTRQCRVTPSTQNHPSNSQKTLTESRVMFKDEVKVHEYEEGEPIIEQKQPTLPRINPTNEVNILSEEVIKNIDKFMKFYNNNTISKPKHESKDPLR